MFRMWGVFFLGTLVNGGSSEADGTKGSLHWQPFQGLATVPHRRQDLADDETHLYTFPTTLRDQKNKEVVGAATRFTTPSTTTKKYMRTTLGRVSFAEDCDYLAQYCMKAYDTGKLCARTLYYTYHNFKNYCLMDYVNCMERYEVWQVVHMGECYIVKELTEYILYPYQDDTFLDQYYILEDN